MGEERGSPPPCWLWVHSWPRRSFGWRLSDTPPCICQRHPTSLAPSPQAWSDSLALAQALLGPSAITWATVLEALISAPVWLVFVGTITAARWRYLSTRDALLHERVRIETTRDIEREALSRARSSVADSVRPALAQLRQEIDTVLAGPRGEPMDSNTSLRHSATSLFDPLSHDLYARGTAMPPRAHHCLLHLRTQHLDPLRSAFTGDRASGRVQPARGTPAIGDRRRFHRSPPGWRQSADGTSASCPPVDLCGNPRGDSWHPTRAPTPRSSRHRSTVQWVGELV